MKKTAILLGATGLTGGQVLNQLIADDRYDTIKLFSRSRMDNLPNKVEQFIGDLLKLKNFKDDFVGDELYCCIGTTKSKTPNKSLYKKIDYGIPVSAAQLAKLNNIETFIVMSSMGANKNSSTFYAKTKGEMEQGVIEVQIKNTYILRPALIGGDRDEQRTMEAIGLKLIKIIQPLFVGSLKKYRIIKAKTIAKAMLTLGNAENYSETIITSDKIQEIETHGINTNQKQKHYQ